MTPLPYIVVVVPTYHRPASLLNNTLANFLAQTYPAERRYMVILDDGQTVDAQKGRGWEVVSSPVRYPDLPTKHNALVALAAERGADAVALWDDDNVPLPDYLANHAHALTTTRMPWSYSSERFADHLWQREGRLVRQRMTSHSMSVFGVDFLNTVGGWPPANGKNFESAFLTNVRKASPGADSCVAKPCQIIIRKHTSGTYHASMIGASTSTTGYNRLATVSGTEPVGVLTPEYDKVTRDMIAWYTTHMILTGATSPDPEGE